MDLIVVMITVIICLTIAYLEDWAIRKIKGGTSIET